MQSRSLKVKNVRKAGPAGEDKSQLGKQQAEIPTAAYKAKTCFASKNEIPQIMVKFCYLKLDCLSVLQWMARNWVRVLKLEKLRRACTSNNLLTTLYSSPFFIMELTVLWISLGFISWINGHDSNSEG